MTEHTGRPTAKGSGGWGVDLSGKCIIVTGGNRGIGLAVSKQMAQAGAHVAIIYNSSEDAPDRAAEIEKEFGVTCKAYQQSTDEQDEMDKLVKQIYNDIGPVGGIVCNAGIAVSKPAFEMTREDFDNQFGINVWGVFSSSVACCKLWKEHGYQNGKVVITSSMSAKVVNKGATQCFYNSSKAAVSMLGKCLADEWRDLGVTVNCINPGYVATDMTSGLQGGEKEEEKMKDVPLARMSQPDEQAGLVVFLISDHASYITGTDMLIDGGYTMW